MFDFAQLAIGAERRDGPILERPPVSGLRIPLGKLGSERSDWAAQLPSGELLIVRRLHDHGYLQRHCYHELGATEAASSSLWIGDCDVTVT